MKIMSFNTQSCTNFITKKIDFQFIANGIKKFDADIVGLNEMRGADPESDFVNQVEELARLAGYEYFYFSKACDIEDDDGPFGNGVLSKYPLKTIETIGIPDPTEKTGNQLYETRAVLKVTLDNGLTVLITHFGLNSDEHINAVKTVLNCLEKEKCVFMGDLNVEPDNEVLKPIQSCLVDTATVIGKDLLSFPSDKPYKKIDYIFVTPDVKIISADIPNIICSDHRPHLAEIEF